MKLPKLLLMLPVAVSLAGCQYDVLLPKGWVGAEQRDLLIISTLLMLIVIIPVLVMAVYFPWKYRASREDNSDYDPEFHHSTKIELAVWGVPILIVLALGWFTYVYTHRLDPYRPLDHGGEPLVVEAVSLDWKWLFIYPEYGVASVNELAMPVGRQVQFKLTSSTVMNTFVVPALGGMVYSMAGMQTQLHLIADHEGTFPGRSAHYSGPGFSQMTFDAKALSDTDFAAWVEKAKQSPVLDSATYLALEKPSMNVPPGFYGTVEQGLFDRIVGMCVEQGKVCMGQVMMQDENGGGGLEGIGDKDKYKYDDERMIDGFGKPMPTQPAPLAPKAPAAGHEQISATETEAAPHVH